MSPDYRTAEWQVNLFRETNGHREWEYGYRLLTPANATAEDALKAAAAARPGWTAASTQQVRVRSMNDAGERLFYPCIRDSSGRVREAVADAMTLEAARAYLEHQGAGALYVAALCCLRPCRGRESAQRTLYLRGLRPR